MHMITLVGVGHIFNLQDAIENILDARRPQAVALELDRNRFIALQQERQGKGGGMYGFLARYQRMLAEDYGTTPGAEMLAAASKARSLGADVALIDMDARQVFQRLWRSMRFREKLYMFFGSIGGLFVRKKKMKEEIDRLQREPEAFIDELEKQLPTAKTVLIDERNIHMANNIKRLRERYPNVVVFVGDGHIPGLSSLVEGEKEIIRLSQLVDGNIPPPPYTPPARYSSPSAVVEENGVSASFGFGNNGAG